MTTVINTALLREIKDETNDCTVRAVSAATGLTYLNAHGLAKLAGRHSKKGFWTDKILREAKANGILDYTKSYMFDMAKLTKSIKSGWGKISHGSPYPTLAQVLPLLSKGRFILETRKHALAVVDGVVYDQGSKLKARYRVVTIFEVKI